MPTKISKPPLKGKGAKYNRSKEKRKLSETPDSLFDGTGGYYSEDAYPFGYVKGKLLYPKYPRGTHWSLLEDNGIKVPMNVRGAFKYPGRLWASKKIFSLWQYPTTLSNWEKLIKDLSTAFRTNVEQNYRVELAKPKDMEDMNPKNIRVIKVKDWMKLLRSKSKPKIHQHSIDTQNLPHLKSPLLKGTQEVPSGIGSHRQVAGLPYTQYFQKTHTSECSLKLKPMIEIVRKIKKINRR
jgi:hypothetical protein